MSLTLKLELDVFGCLAYVGLKTKWSEEELAFLRDHRTSSKRPLKFPEIRKMQRLMPALRNRTLAQIKARAWALQCNKK